MLFREIASLNICSFKKECVKNRHRYSAFLYLNNFLHSIESFMINVFIYGHVHIISYKFLFRFTELYGMM